MHEDMHARHREKACTGLYGVLVVGAICTRICMRVTEKRLGQACLVGVVCMQWYKLVTAASWPYGQRYRALRAIIQLGHHLHHHEGAAVSFTLRMPAQHSAVLNRFCRDVQCEYELVSCW